MTSFPNDWKDAKSTPLDFIVVGAGAGGAPLAARLVERGYTVLVIEMGPAEPALPSGTLVENTHVPLLHSETTEDPRHSLRYFVKHFDEDPDKSQDPKVNKPAGGMPDDKGIFYPRAQGIGGCTVHNAMITICGLSEDWDEIAEATGDESWRGERMRAYFQRVENCHYARPGWFARLTAWLGFGTGWENARHGDRGWLATTLSDLRFLKRDWTFLKIVLGGAVGAIKAGVESATELIRLFYWGRVQPGLDPNHWETMRRSEEGLSRIPCAITPDGERSSPRSRLLQLAKDPIRGKRLHLLPGTFVTKVALQEGNETGTVGGKVPKYRATGVECILREHLYEADPNVQPLKNWSEQVVTLHCRREVILAGGAFNTPQLLMLSGIGPEEHLRKYNIKPLVPLEGVGQNLQDRYEVPVVAKVNGSFRSLEGIGLSSASQRTDPELKKWVANAGQPAFKRGLYSTNGGLVGIFVRSGQEDASPDLFVFALAGHFPGYHVGWSKPAALLGLDKNATPDDIATTSRRDLTWLILKARTRHHQGYVRLQSSSPFQRPEINFRSFPNAPDSDLDSTLVGVDTKAGEDQFQPSADQDLEALYQGVRFVQSILRIGETHGTIESQKLPGVEPFGDNVRKWIKHVAWGHHACGTCRIGADNDPIVVLDSRFRVRGVRGLRVVDASVFPRIPGFFIVSNIYMVAEKAADVLAEDHPLDHTDQDADVQEALRLDPVLHSSPEAEARRLYPADLEVTEARLIVARRRQAGLITTNTDGVESP